MVTTLSVTEQKSSTDFRVPFVDIEELLAHLEMVRQTGLNSWEARAPCHEDHDPSLSIKIDGNEILLYCHSCKISGYSVLETIGLEGKQLRVRPPSARADNPSRKDPVYYPHVKAVIRKVTEWTGMAYSREWVYHNRDGEEVFRVGRFNGQNGDKTFRPYYRTEKGWAIADPPGLLPLYRLPEWNNSQEPIWIGEGEKAADDLREWGFKATTTAHGSNGLGTNGKLKTDLTPLAGRSVYIFPDNDSGGEKYAQALCALLSKLDPPAQVKIVQPEGLPAKGDVVEYKVIGGTKEELLALAEKAQVYEGLAKQRQEDVELPACTDSANGQWFANLNQGKAYWCEPWGTWLVRTDTCLKRDSTRQIDSLAVQAIRRLLADAGVPEDKKLAAWAKTSLSDSRQRAMLERAKHYLAVEPEQLDSNPMLLNCPNGIYDLAALEFRQRQAEDLVTQTTGVIAEASNVPQRRRCN